MNLCSSPSASDGKYQKEVRHQYDYSELLWPRYPFHGYARTPEEFPMTHDTMDKLKWIIERYSLNGSDIKGSTLLHLAVNEQWREAIIYLLTCKDIDVGCYNGLGETPLILACKNNNMLITKRLIDSGADVNQCSVDGLSPLYYAMKSCLEMQGVSISDALARGTHFPWFRTRFGPIHLTNKDCDLVYMLLYYGAIVSTAEHTLLMYFMTTAPLDCVETLLFHYLDTIDKVDLDFITMIISRKLELFPVILGRITKVDWKNGQLKYNIFDVDQLVALLKKFPGFRKYFCKVYEVWRVDTFYNPDQRLVLEIFGKFIFKMAEESLLSKDLFYKTKPATIQNIVQVYKKFKLSEIDLTKLILILVSYGVPVCILDFLEVHSYFGSGFLVEVFLHMTIDILESNLPTRWLMEYQSRVSLIICSPLNQDLRVFITQHLMGLLLYKPNFDFNCNIADCPPLYLLGVNLKILNPISAFRYFACSEFRKFISKFYSQYEDIKELLRQPRFPSLMELSRNAAQKHIYHIWGISDQNPGKYYDIVKRLPVHNNCKQILTFDVDLYSV